MARLEQRLAVTVQRGDSIEVEADSDQIEQALINLVKNAADAALPRGEVSVRWLARDGAAWIEVEDTGPGLASTDNLFVPFFTTKPSGSGIGLVLARQIVEAHGGHLTLANRGDRQGCVARVILPL